MTDLRVPPAAKPAVPAKPGGRPATRRPRRGRRALWHRVHAAVLRIDAATPAGRDRAVDVLRALAILGVVLGHWMVSAVVLQAGGHLAGDSPLRQMPGFTPMSWLLQPLAVFFFVGGRVGAHSCSSAMGRGVRYRTWLAGRMTRLLRPAVPLVATWGLVLAGLAAAGVAPETIHTLLWLAFSPLWFLAVYALLTAATALVTRAAGPIAVAALVVVVGTDSALGAFGDGGWVSVVRWLNVPAGWLIPYCLGAIWASGGLARRRCAVIMLVGGAVATAVSVLWCGYPASMVGVPGAPLSNLNPPTAAAVSFGLAQCGAALLLSGPLRRSVSGPAAGACGAPGREASRATAGQFLWAAVVSLNLSAITVFLWHQTAMITTTVVPLGLGHRLFGLHTAPDVPLWAAARLAWTPVFAAVLLLLWAGFRSWERAPRPPSR